MYNSVAAFSVVLICFYVTKNKEFQPKTYVFQLNIGYTRHTKIMFFILT